MHQLDWLKDPTTPRIFGNFEKIRRNYTVEEFIGDVRSEGVVGSVYIQVNWPQNKELAEVEWIQNISNNTGWPSAMIGYVDFSRPNCSETLERMSKFPIVRGIRQQLHWHRNPAFKFAKDPDIMMNKDWQKNFALLQDYGWVFELQIFSTQMKNAAKLANAHKKTPMILQHCGMPEDRSISGMAAWAEGVKRLADEQNVFCKFSGLGTFIHRNSSDFIHEITGKCLEIFGINRCLFGSNFPIEKIWTTYEELFFSYRDALRHLEANDQNKVFYSNAKILYNISF